MSSSRERSIRAVELAVIASEGPMVVDGVRFTSYIDAELARRAFAERVIDEAQLLCRYLRLEPPCAWCGSQIKPTQATREVDGRLFHDTDELQCAQAFEDEAGAYAADYAAAHPEHSCAPVLLDARPIATLW
jgi:hypothetical protein